MFNAVINSNPEKNCIDALIESSVDHKFKYFYGLELPDNIGITNHFILSKKLNNIPVTLNIDSDYFDMCYSSEGIHFNIWDSIKKKERFFHDYVYLNFDTIDNCSEEDYSETSG